MLWQILVKSELSRLRDSHSLYQREISDGKKVCRCVLCRLFIRRYPSQCVHTQTDITAWIWGKYFIFTFSLKFAFQNVFFLFLSLLLFLTHFSILSVLLLSQTPSPPEDLSPQQKDPPYIHPYPPTRTHTHTFRNR